MHNKAHRPNMQKGNCFSHTVHWEDGRRRHDGAEGYVEEATCSTELNFIVFVYISRQVSYIWTPSWPSPHGSYLAAKYWIEPKIAKVAICTQMTISILSNYK